MEQDESLDRTKSRLWLMLLAAYCAMIESWQVLALRTLAPLSSVVEDLLEPSCLPLATQMLYQPRDRKYDHNRKAERWIRSSL